MCVTLTESDLHTGQHSVGSLAGQTLTWESDPRDYSVGTLLADY